MKAGDRDNEDRINQIPYRMLHNNH